MKQYVIFGDSAFAERIYRYIQCEGIHRVLCFTNEKEFIVKDKIENLEIIPFEYLSEQYDKESFEILICIGYAQMNRLREKIYNLCKKSGYRIGTWISSAAISYSEDIAEGSLIMPGVLIGPTTRIGVCNIIASRVCISHDSVIGDFNFISSSVVFGGFSNVQTHSFIGLNATIKDGVTIKDFSLIGLASNVLKSTETKGVYVGNPARKLENRNSLETKI